MMRLKKHFLFALWCLAAVPGFAQAGFGEAGNINGQWKFTLGDNMKYREADHDDSSWETVTLPHDWSVRQPLSPSLASCTGYLPGGIGWYRKTIGIPADREGKKQYLYFEGVYNRSEVFVNGQSLGKRPNGYISFGLDITPYVRFGEDNHIAVRVDHSEDADSRWYTGSGIYRNVWLVSANPVHIGQWGVYAYPEVKGRRGQLHTETSVVNETGETVTLKVVNELFSASGNSAGKQDSSIKVAAGSTGKASGIIKVNNPELWSLDTPNLYTLKTTVYRDGKVTDRSEVTTGFRTFTFDADKGFALNGEWMKMKGVCLHHDAGVLGAAVPKEVWASRLSTLKSMGVNAIRTSHNPQSPEFYQVCDEIGLLVLNEAYDEWKHPKRKWKEGWNVGTPGFQGSYDYFEEWAEKDLEDMVRRDRNHMSVFAWSIGNEVDYPNDPYSHPVLDGGKDTGFQQPAFGGYKPDAPDAMELGVIAEKLVAAVKRHDTSRPVTAGLAGVAMSNQTAYPGALDIVGYNYTESKYAEDHEKYPDRVIYGSENGQGLDAWKAVVENEYIFGQFLWTGFDYLGESGRWPSRGFYTGLVDLSGNIKPRGQFRRSLWSDEPFIYAGTYVKGKRDRLSIDAWPLWNYKEGEQVRVVSYTNTEAARLELNGKVVGEVRPYDNKTGIIHWDIPFAPGRLEVVGLEQGKETCRYAVESSSRPYALEIVESPEMMEKGEVAQVRIQVVDENGIPVMLSDEEITCTIEGPATLLGLEAGNNSDMTDYTDNVQRAFHGKLLAYIRPEKKADITVTFSSPWLAPVSRTVTVQ
ncbi:sugar-binding domain-containing protein [Sinomicrobium soli]|uniref:sugar-binding domain-containing protein n=1 Tax=Sinomicrobium sp. N-1-3-6 TaxID=2219864 RepID=UPI000DCE8790|nr:sugar-binding domain-containing protein [Sinomicrobium sp. N-1-3-6]RAV30184.1 glycoside hydrolase family 2 [Sinomicrobium sp. N-1-3-6]